MRIRKFQLASLEHANSIDAMRRASNSDLTTRLGIGRVSDTSRGRAIRERIECGDLTNLRRNTLFVVTEEGEAVGSVAVSTFPPGFWRKAYWRESEALGLGVFGLVVYPERQRQGIGRLLMNGVEGLAAERGIRFVRLDAYVANPGAIDFYRALGYEERAIIELRGCGLMLFEKPVG